MRRETDAFASDQVTYRSFHRMQLAPAIAAAKRDRERPLVAFLTWHNDGSYPNKASNAQQACHTNVVVVDPHHRAQDGTSSLRVYVIDPRSGGPRLASGVKKIFLDSTRHTKGFEVWICHGTQDHTTTSCISRGFVILENIVIHGRAMLEALDFQLVPSGTVNSG